LSQAAESVEPANRLDVDLDGGQELFLDLAGELDLRLVVDRLAREDLSVDLYSDRAGSEAQRREIEVLRREAKRAAIATMIELCDLRKRRAWKLVDSPATPTAIHRGSTP
jgi:hypothetical protein